MMSFFKASAVGAAVLAGGVVASAAAPSNGYYEYRGSLIITGIDVVTPSNKTCAGFGYAVGDEYNIRFAPPGSTLGKNGTTWRLSIFSRVHAQSFIFASAPTATLTNPTSTMVIGRGHGTFAVPPLVAITKQTPATVTTSTTTVYLEGKIQNFASTASTKLSEGCDVSFRASATLKP